MKREKILIISHNPMNQIDNMGKTIRNIFSNFKTNELCQLYFKKQDVDSESCKEFFCIDDRSMCKSILNRKYRTGRKVANNFKMENISSNNKNNIMGYGRKKTGLTYCLRDFVWKIGKWNTEELKDWIVKQNISCIFLLAGDYTFPFDIAINLSKTYNLPLYVYFVDEYYRKNVGKQTIFAKFYKAIYRKKFKKLVKYSQQYFCISEAMCDFYKEQFGKSGIVLMNTTKLIREELGKEKSDKNLVISYIGNLDYDRWRNLVDIANVIEHKKLDSKIEFNVYSGESNHKIIEIMNTTKNLSFKGKISSSEVINKIKESDILLHVENFDKANINNVKYSVSTKIPDLLASGKLLMAYGPKEVESINYIMRNNAGIIIDNVNDIANVLSDLIECKLNSEIILSNAISLVEKNHRNEIIYEKLTRYLINRE